MKKILIATQKPFATAAVNGIKKITKEAGYTCEVLEKYDTQDALIDALKDVNAIIIRSDKITEEVIDAAKNLQIIVRAGAGYDNVDLQAASDKDICVMNTPGQNANAVAELVLGMMVYQARGQFNGNPGVELKGKTLGIHAFGNVGKKVASIAKGFDMKVFAFDPFVSPEVIEKEDVVPVENIDELYKKCQYVSLHIPVNDKTVKSINYVLLRQMPDNAVLVNTARKEVIDEDGILELMKDRPDFTYISDIAPDNATKFAEKYVGRYYFTPKKMGAQTAEANINAGLAASKQIVDYLENGVETFRVN